MLLGVKVVPWLVRAAAVVVGLWLLGWVFGLVGFAGPIATIVIVAVSAFVGDFLTNQLKL